MTTRASTLKVGTFLSGGAVRASTLKVGVFLDAPEKVRVSTLKIGAFVDDHTNGIRVTTLRLAGWISLSDQGLYLELEPFGSNEVFTPSIQSIFVPQSPQVPDVEVNPYRVDVPNVDQQRIMREQHNLTQAGDSTFHWGVLTEISATALYNLGSVGRFYHDEFGISIARYVKFTKMVETVAKAIPVGLNRKLNQPWTVTNQLELSDANSVMGVACPYNGLIYSGSWYGWVIVDGFVPAEMDISLDNSVFEWGTEYGWSETGKVKPGVDGPSLGTRFTTTKVPNLKPGEFLVKVNPLSLARLAGLITTQLGPLTTQVAGLVTQVNALAATSTTHSTQIGQLQSQAVGLDNRITSESEAVARQLAAIRALIPDVDYKTYVDGQVEMLTIRMDNQDSIIGQVANDALARVSELELKFDSLSTVALQSQIDALNDSMGGITDRLIGFTTEIDTNVLTAGQVLVSVDAGLTPGGTQLYTFQPVDLAVSSLIDVDLSTAPADGDALCWDNTLGRWVPSASGGSGIPDAPSDGTLYGRKDAAWEAVPSGGGGSPAWTLIDQSGAPTTSPTWTWSTNVANVDVTNLDDYNELLIIAKGVGSSSGATGVRSIVVSVDNGANFYTTSGNYLLVSSTGTETAETRFLFHNTGSGSARTLLGWMNLKGPIKKGQCTGNTPDRLFVGSASDINAIRFANIDAGSIAGNLTSGDLYVYAR